MLFLGVFCKKLKSVTFSVLLSFGFKMRLLTSKRIELSFRIVIITKYEETIRRRKEALLNPLVSAPSRISVEALCFQISWIWF